MSTVSVAMRPYKTPEYNEVPVVFCKHCLSLKVYCMGEEDSYCGDCGRTEMCAAPIEDWEKMYKARYGKPFISKSNNKGNGEEVRNISWWYNHRK